MIDLIEDKELAELGAQLDKLFDRIEKGLEYVAAHPEDAKAPAMLSQLKARLDELLNAVYVRSWEKVTLSFPFPEDHEFGDRPPVVVLDQQAIVRTDENGLRVIDVTYTRPQLQLVAKLLSPS